MKASSHPYLAALLLSLTAEAACADRLVDPTRPSNAKEVVREAYRGLRLEAILRSDERLLAIVNGKIVRQGDRVAGAHIDEIREDSIRYTLSGRTEIARLSNQSVPVRSNVQSEEDQ